MFTALSLGYLFDLSVLELGKFACVLENLNEALFVEGLLRCFSDSANGLAGCL